MTHRNWKAHIISLTGSDEARSRKIDASFFPPVEEARLLHWESEHGVPIPDSIRSFLRQSDGLEAQRGEIWPVLPFAEWEFLHDECSGPDPWIRFGETEHWRYLLSLGHSPSIYRHASFGSDEEFFASSFDRYLEKIFRGEG